MNNSRIGIYKYLSSNSFSLISALDKISVDYETSNNLDDLLNFKKIIIPGIGNMKSFFNEIKPSSFAEKLINFTDNNGVIYGICLGMQIFLNKSEEGNTKTLGIIDGESIALKKDFIMTMNVGYKKISFNNNLVFKNLFSGIENSKFYFLHKYHCVVDDKFTDKMYSRFENKNIITAIYKHNVLGTQFHPELSGESGLKFLKNFCNYKF